MQKALERLPVVAAFLDGEVVVETEHGTPDFGALQQDLSEGRSDRFCYYLFDLLHLDGIDLTRVRRCSTARARSRGLLAGHDDGVLKLSEHFTERGDIVFKHAARLGLEGIVSKLTTAPYRSGRTKAWLKSKCIGSDEFVVIGYVPSTTQRRTVGSLVLGYIDKGKLVYAGRVGSGFSTARPTISGGGSRRSASRRRRSAAPAAAGDAPQRSLGQAVVGGRGRDARLDRRRHPAPCRLQGPAARQAGRRRRPRETRHEEPKAQPHFPSRSPIPTASCGPMSA